MRFKQQQSYMRWQYKPLLAKYNKNDERSERPDLAMAAQRWACAQNFTWPSRSCVITPFILYIILYLIAIRNVCAYIFVHMQQACFLSQHMNPQQ